MSILVLETVHADIESFLLLLDLVVLSLVLGHEDQSETLVPGSARPRKEGVRQLRGEERRENGKRVET